MRIKIDQWEVLRAIELYFKSEYDVDYDLVEGLHEWPIIDYQKTTLFPKKHKNGKVVLNKKGYAEMDHTKTTHQKTSVKWTEFDSITFYLPSKS
tara:strand:- start:832 stop:1113 length:282 start_codon:yes stop_codon:yes gene_type:complete